jgi:hypothetical protein
MCVVVNRDAALTAPTRCGVSNRRVPNHKKDAAIPERVAQPRLPELPAPKARVSAAGGDGAAAADEAAPRRRP